jgi:hypothetical protein
MRFEITDQHTYRTVYFTIESEEGKSYQVNLREYEFNDEWSIIDEDYNEVEDEEICSELINICEAELNK